MAIADIKQIGGRAGRYRSAHQDTEASKEKEIQDLAAAKGEEKPSQTELQDSTLILSHESASENSQAVSAVDADDKSSSQSSTIPSGTDPAFSTIGLVTTLENFDFPVIQRAMKGEPEPIRTAGIFPPAPIVERFATYFPPGTPFSYILMRLHELSQMHSRFHLCGLKDQLWIADLIEPVQGLTTTDKNILCACPAGKSDADLFKVLIPALARCIERQSGGSLLDIAEMPLEVLELEISASRDYLRQLERLHKGLVAYLWLSYRFAGIFSTRPLAFYVKGLVEEKIETVLSQFSFTESQRRKITAAREKNLLDDLKREILLSPEENAAVKPSDAEDTNEELIDKVMSQPDTQTSYAVGGDRFGGENDLDVMDPIERLEPDDFNNMGEKASALGVEPDLPPKIMPTSFAKWRLSHLNPRDEDELGWDRAVAVNEAGAQAETGDKI